MSTRTFTTAAPTELTAVKLDRIQSVDFVRGLVMVLMAIDHVRVYSGLPAGGPEAGIFLTRWVTHFCAPVFVFLTGTSAFLYGRKLATPALAKYLLTRGALLIVLEFTLIRFAWTFNLNFSEFALAGVIWMIGACMVMMAGLVYLRPTVVGIIGVVVIFFQNVFGAVPMLFSDSFRQGAGRYWEFIYSSGLDKPEGITILYVLVPWIGIMSVGYAFGQILEKEPASRRKTLIAIGGIATLLFVMVGIAVAMRGEDDTMPLVFQVLNQRKYPASQLYVLMTLGPAILLMPFVENMRSRFSKAIVMFGKVPFFYYLMHIPLIHVTAMIVNVLREGRTLGEWYATAPFVWFPEEGHQWSLPLLYAVFAVDVVILYFLCRWYEGYKFRNREKSWLKYV
jgi:uncharacterized membrane protein